MMTLEPRILPLTFLAAMVCRFRGVLPLGAAAYLLAFLLLRSQLSVRRTQA